MFCSTIIPTVGRATLERAVESILNQQLDTEDFEVIVVNDSGYPLPEAAWQLSERVIVVNTNRHERSVARNTGAALARGRYLHFLDDDDWLAPSAFNHFWELTERGADGWLYGISQLVDREDTPLIQLHHGLSGNCFVHTMAGEWVPLQASLIPSDLYFRIGGFNPLLVGPEDIDLLRRATLTSNLNATPNLVAFVTRGDSGSTTDYAAHPRASRWAREKILDTPGAYARLWASAQGDELRGKIARMYFTSMMWNIHHRRTYAAFERGILGILSIFKAWTSLVSFHYWSAVFRSYASPTFARGFDVTAKPLSEPPGSSGVLNA